MGLYEKYVLPKVVHYACTRKPNMKQREKVVPLAEGRVLEIGIGSGINLPFYDASKVSHIWGLDPSEEMWSIAKKKSALQGVELEYIKAGAEDIPLDSQSVDTVLITYTLCTIQDVLISLSEMRRVLKNNGKLVFCEHGMAPDRGVRRWQNVMNPVWKQFSGGCNLNRLIPDLIKEGGFQIKKMETMYIPGLKPLSFNYWGVAIRG